MSRLTATLSCYWNKIEGSLFPWLEETLDSLTAKQQQLIEILELVRIEEFLPNFDGCEGRPRKTRTAIARSFVAKTIYNMDTTTALIERLKTDRNMRRICGWESLQQLPSDSTFSRAFAEFTATKLPQNTHEALIKKTLEEEVIQHAASDATAIEAREKAAVKPELNAATDKVIRKRGRPKKGEERPTPKPTRIERQKSMSLEEMLEDLPIACDKGAKKTSKGHLMYWTGYKLHLNTVDGGIPVSAVVTSASVHDSQVAIPLITLTAERIINCYDLMDSAYDIPAIIEYSRSLGHVPLVDKNPGRNRELERELKVESLARKATNFTYPEDRRYNERTVAERANARLKDEFGARKIRVRGGMKVACHLMFGVLVLAADQLIKLIN